MPLDSIQNATAGQQRIHLTAGCLTMELEPDSGFLRYVRLGDREVLRGIYAAVRDRNWGTVTPELSDLQIERGDDTFRVTFTVRCRQAEIDFQWQGEIVGGADGALDYRLDGIARSTFLRNRIGFCVLHDSATCAGAACTIEHVDGRRQETNFPSDIAPHQPFQDIRSISHHVLPDMTACVLLEGDTFETEDQRNWTDASFKTYCTPLGLPFPAEIAQGTRVRQSVSLRLIDHTSPTRKPRSKNDSLAPVLRGEGGVRGGKGPEPEKSCDIADAPRSRVGWVSRAESPLILRCGPACRLPRIGLGVASHGIPLSPQAQSRLSLLRLDHLRVSLDLSDGGFEARLKAATAQAKQIGAALHVAVTLRAGAEEALPRLAEQVRAATPAIGAWLVYDGQQASTSAALFQAVRSVLHPVTPNAAFAMGTDANFAELNRGRPPAGLADGVCYSINPQVHAFDDDSLVETLEAQRDTVVSARRFAGRSKVAVSPVTLKPRFNAVATGPEPEPPPGQLPPQVDRRQATRFAAAWTLGSIAALASGGAASVTYFETTGWQGIMETDEGSPLPERFPSLPGCVFPVYHLLADLAEFAGCEIQPVVGDVPLRVQGLVVKRGGGGSLWLANLARQPQQVRLPDDIGASGGTRLRLLDGDNVSKAMTSPETFRHRPWLPLVGRELLLTPHAVARVDYETDGSFLLQEQDS